MFAFFLASLLVPAVFAPGVISSAAHDSSPAFTPDGNTVYFTRSNNAASIILVSTKTGDVWSKPTVAAFSGAWLDMEPAMAPDGSYLIFASNRPATRGARSLGPSAANLWRVDRTRDGWSEPQRLPDAINSGTSVYAPSVAANGDLYFMLPDAKTKRFRLFLGNPDSSGSYVVEPLTFSDGSNTDVDPAIAPDESFMIFGSGRHLKRDIDLFITFKRSGVWSEPAYLGDTINSPSSDAEPRLAPDGHTLYFSSDRVVPVAQPIATGTAAAILDDMTSWNNGLYNIWYVDIASIVYSRKSSSRASISPSRST